MRRTLRLVLVLCALGALAAPAALAAERMWVGFHDDPSFRWSTDRTNLVQGSASDGAAIMRLLVQWNLVAPQRPSIASDPFDPSYRFDDLDEALREAQRADMEVMLTISGTPRWANGGKASNFMPARVSDLTAFSRAIASRYNGRNDGYPFVRFWSVWNEPNLTRFLTPQFGAGGRSVAPANYARLYAAAWTGIKAGNPLAKVGDRRDVPARERQAAGSAARSLAREVRRARRQGEPAAQVRRVVASPVLVQPELRAGSDRQVAERHARLADPLQHGAQALVQAQVGADLDHRVRV